MDNRASAWSVTINNPQPSDYEEIAIARQKGWKVEGQVEKGEEGTLHLQLAVRTPQVRFSAVKKQFSRAHIEPARNVTALSKYVAKAATRVAQLPSGSDKYPSLSRFWELVAIRLNAGHETWTWDDKEAFHTDESMENKHVVFYRQRTHDKVASDPLKTLDEVTATLIGEGYHVEGIAANPSTRVAFKKWWGHILYRAMETLRQTDEQRVQVPEFNSTATEHSQLDADDDARTTPSPRVLEGSSRTGESPQGESDASRSTYSEGSHEDC